MFHRWLPNLPWDVKTPAAKVMRRFVDTLRDLDFYVAGVSALLLVRCPLCGYDAHRGYFVDVSALQHQLDIVWKPVCKSVLFSNLISICWSSKACKVTRQHIYVAQMFTPLGVRYCIDSTFVTSEPAKFLAGYSFDCIQELGRASGRLTYVWKIIVHNFI